MAEIKSAYEKAMERFQDVAPDRTGLQKSEFVKKGKSACAKKLQGESVDMLGEINQVEDANRKYFIQGVSVTLLAQINLPANEYDIQKIQMVNDIAISYVEHTDAVQDLLSQFAALADQYLKSKTELTEQIKVQYMQMVEQQQRGGGMDPHVMQAMQEQMKQLEDSFSEPLTQIRKHFKNMLGLDNHEENDE